MPRIIWSRPGNPTRIVSSALGITRPQLSRALHRIKDGVGLEPHDNVRIWDDGSVTDDRDVWVGNIYDEI